MPAKTSTASTGRRLDAALASPARGPRRPPGLPAGSPPPTLARGPAPMPALKPGAGVRRACGVHPFPFTGTVPRAHRASRRPRLTAPPSQLTPAGGSPSFTVGPDGPVIHRPPSGMGYATATTSGRPAPSTARQDATASTGQRLDLPPPPQAPRPARRTHGRGETRRRQAPPPCLRSIRTPAPIFEHRGGQKNWMNEIRSRCQASTSFPEASRAPRTPVVALEADRAYRHGATANRTEFGQPKAARRPIPRRDACTPAFCPFSPCTPPARHPLPRASGGRKGSPTALQRRDSGGWPASHAR